MGVNHVVRGTMNQPDPKQSMTQADEDRRRFLKSCGRFAAVTPPALAVLMSTTLKAQASSNRHGHSDHGDHGGDDDKGKGKGKD
jgi:hypothetical protein